MDHDESKLVEDLKANRPGSFEVLLERYGPRLTATASRMLGNPADAEDVVQDSLIAAWKGVGGFEGSSSLYTWLHRIIVNQALDRMRTARWKAELNATLSGLEPRRPWRHYPRRGPSPASLSRSASPCAGRFSTH